MPELFVSITSAIDGYSDISKEEDELLATINTEELLKLDILKPCISNGKTKTRKSIIERNLKKK